MRRCDVDFASDVVALTSDSEGTPVALIEARAAGLPVAAMTWGEWQPWWTASSPAGCRRPGTSRA